jgi:hypothetical protein
MLSYFLRFLTLSHICALQKNCHFDILFHILFFHLSGIHVYVKRCGSCDLYQRYQTLKDGVHNFNDHLFLTTRLCLYLRGCIQVSLSHLRKSYILILCPPSRNTLQSVEDWKPYAVLLTWNTGRTVWLDISISRHLPCMTTMPFVFLVGPIQRSLFSMEIANVHSN